MKEVDDIVQAIYDHENFASPTAVVRWRDLYQILQKQLEITGYIFKKNLEFEDERKKLLIYKKAYKKQKARQADSAQLKAKDEEVYSLQNQLRDIQEQNKILQSENQELKENQDSLLVEHDEHQRKILDLEQDLKLKQFNSTLDNQQMQSQFEDQINKLELEKVVFRQKIEEMHNALIKRSQQTVDKV